MRIGGDGVGRLLRPLHLGPRFGLGALEYGMRLRRSGLPRPRHLELEPLPLGEKRGERLRAAAVHGDREVLLDELAPGLRLRPRVGLSLLRSGPVGDEPLPRRGDLGVELGADLGDLPLRSLCRSLRRGTDRRRVLLRGGDQPFGLLLRLRAELAGVLLGATEHLPGFVLGEPQHRPHPLAHALDALRRTDQIAYLHAEPLDAQPRVVELLGELGGLVERGIPVGGQNLDLGIQPA
ncbi:MAG TPA: hypothetical protein VNO83_15385 [Pseudonocardia sp.]|nr:hypothetical protein [Pseudonocardia sp.]